MSLKLTENLADPGLHADSPLVRIKACAFFAVMACCRFTVFTSAGSNPQSLLGRRLGLILLFIGGVGLPCLAENSTLPPTPASTTNTNTSVLNPPVTPTDQLRSATIPAPRSPDDASDVGKQPKNQINAGKAEMSSEHFMATLATALVAALNKPVEKEPKDWTAIWVALIATGLSGLVSYMVCKLTIKAAKTESVFKAGQELEKARIDTSLVYTSKMLDLQYRQLENFYAPLLARAQQCHGIQAKLVLYLYNQSPEQKYHWRDESKNEKRLQIKIGQDWFDFRLLDQLPTLAADKIAMALVDQILVIVREMEVIIRKHNGLASVDKQMSPVYGRFLAHVVILNLERVRLKDPSSDRTAHSPGSHGDAYYPRELDEIITQEYNAAREAVKKYKATSDKALKWLDEAKI